MPTQILSPYRVSVSAIHVRVKGQGQYRVEVKNAGQAVIFQDTHTLNSGNYVDAFFTLPVSLPQSKLLTLVVESTPINSDLYFDQVDLVCNMPEQLDGDPLLYGLLTSYCQLLRGFDDSGFTRDHNNFPIGDFDSVPAMGFQIAGAALARDMGFITLTDAQDLADRSTAALLTVAREPTTGLLPHWLRNGQRHPLSEWSSVDTALACVPAIQGLTALGMTARAGDVYAGIVNHLNFPAFVNSDGEILHGVLADGSPSPYAWTQWGGELTIVEVLRALSSSGIPPAANAQRDCEHFGGRGFIIELAALTLPQFGAAGYGCDQYGADWNARRTQHMNAQSSFIGHSLFGLSPVEIISYEDATTPYLEAGIGTSNPVSLPLMTLPAYGSGPWVAPHYMSMVAGLDITAASSRLRLMRDTLGVWPVLNGPAESIELNTDGSLNRWHRLQGSLNAFFNTAGLYHGICTRDLRTDCIYAAVAADARLQRGVNVIFHGRAILGDFDENGKVDEGDLATLQECTTGAGVPYSAILPADCALEVNSLGYLPADLDRDHDVDQDDFGLFQRCYAGRGLDGDPNCANP